MKVEISMFDRSSTPSRQRREFLKRVVHVGAGAVLAPSLILAGGEASYADIFPKPSMDKQKQVGREAAKQVLKKYPEVFDQRADAFRRMGEQLVVALSPDDQKWDFSFHVLDSKEVNAFALPGGPMFMFTGLYNLLASLDAMAAVTGHEMTHVRKEHWAKAYQQQQKRKAVVTGLGLLFSRATIPVASLASLTSSAIGQQFSRDEEDEADAGGLENMVNAGFNPEGMVELFKALQQVSGNGSSSFLADHPLTSERIKKTEKAIAKYGDRQFPPLTPLVGSTASGLIAPPVPQPLAPPT